MAMDYLLSFKKGGGKKKGDDLVYEDGEEVPRWRKEIKGIVESLNTYDQDGRNNRIYEELGIKPIWLDDYHQIPDVLRAIQEGGE